MIDFLLGVPGKLNALMDRLTATRAAYLDAAITSRASASALATVDSEVGLILADTADMQPLIDSMSQYGTTVRDTWYGVGSESNSGDTTNVTLATAVTDISKCIILVNGHKDSNYNITARLTSTTNLRVTYGGTSTSTTGYYGYTITEFY